MKFNRLYAKSSTGKIKIWEIEAVLDTMIIRSGYEDGKVMEQRKVIEGKNIGRANETTPAKQCELECQSKWQKKVDEQYTPFSCLCWH
jgi:DNA ligase-1